MSGFSAISLLFVFYSKYRMQALKYILCCDAFIGAILTFDTFNLYIRNLDSNLNSEIKDVLILFGLFASNVGVEYAFALLSFHTAKSSLPSRVKNVFLATTITAVAFMLSLLVLFKGGFLQGDFATRTAFTTITVYASSWQIYCILFLLRHMKAIEPVTKLPVLIAAAIVSVLAPLSVVSELLQYGIDFHIPVAFSPVKFLFMNVLIIYFTRNYFTKEKAVTGLSSEPPADEQTEAFLRCLSSEYNITGRELEILLLVIDGNTNQEIGNQLFISPNTVKNHISNIYRKLEVRNRYELINLVHHPVQK